MKKGTSLYLDLVRFSAAVVVFLEHFKEHTRNSLNAFWRSHPFLYSHLDAWSLTAVIVFFVLSGYVIAHVLATRERTPLEFAASRIGRLYSVAIPALILTAATNSMEAWRYPGAFDAYANIPEALRYLGTGAFVSHFWLWPDLEPANTPFWSLSFEASYYAGIALFVFARGRMRIFALLALSALAGPTMVLLAPTWLLGFAAYRLSQRPTLRAALAIVSWLATALLLASCFLIEENFRQPLFFLRMPDASVGGLLASYAAAICFAVNIVTFDAFSEKAAPLLRPFSGLIRWLGSMTFALYLFHQPLLSFFTVYPVGGRSSVVQVIVMVGGTFLFVATIGYLCERSKGVYKRLFLSIWKRASGLRFSSDAQTQLQASKTEAFGQTHDGIVSPAGPTIE